MHKFKQLPYLSIETLPLPSSLSALITLISGTPEAVDEGDFTLVYQWAHGPSAANYLGRFCHLDEELKEAVQATLKQEEATQPSAVYAEIVHLNQGRVGNIVTRPVLRSYEIPILVQPGVDDSYTIRLEDLMISFRNDQLILKSKSSGKRVIPRLSTAHNYALLALPFYQFLCDLQYDNTQSRLEWQWGALNHMSFLPRVTFSKTILSKARWLLTSELQPIVGLTGKKLANKMKEICLQLNLPRQVVVVDDDYQIPLDLEDEMGLKILQTCFKPPKAILLEECLTEVKNLLVESKGQLFVNELIVPLTYKSSLPIHKEANNSTQVSNNNTLPIRRFGIGSSWLYLKLYCGFETSENLLINIIHPLTEKLLAEKVIDQWFFIRYIDYEVSYPKTHIRVRFHCYGVDDHQVPLPEFNGQPFYALIIREFNKLLEEYVEASLLTNFTTDCYVRELERYGYSNIIASEFLFFYDSIAVIKLIPHFQKDTRQSLRFPVALMGIETLLTDFQLDLDAKIRLMHRLQLNFKEEFKVTHANSRKSLGILYRQHRSQIELAFEKSHQDEQLRFATLIFEERSENLKPIIALIKVHCQNTTISGEIENLLTSYIHMFINRLYPYRQRKYELVIYDFLFQYYSSLQNRRKVGLSI